MRSIVRFWCVVLLIFGGSIAPVLAQQKLFIRTPTEVIQVDPRQSSMGTVIRRFAIPSNPLPPSGHDTATYGGGRFLAWDNEFGQVLVLDTETGRVQDFSFPGFASSRVLGSDGNIRVVVLGTNPALMVTALVVNTRTGTVHLWPLGPQGMVGPVVYAPARNLLFVPRRRTNTPGPGTDYHDVEVINADTGEHLKTIDISLAFAGDPSPAFGKTLAVDSMGNRLFVGGFSSGTFSFDVSSGTVSASNSAAFGLFPIIDELRNRFITTDVGLLSAFSADALDLQGRVSIPTIPLPPPDEMSGGDRTHDLDVSGLSATIFAVEGFNASGRNGPICESQLLALDVDTGAIRRKLNTTNTLGEACIFADVVRVTEPSPPRVGTLSVDGHRVGLAWDPPLGATHYDIEVASSPGGANIATFRVAEPQLIADGVPPGVYYVRARSINTIGASAPSAEVTIVVQ